MSLVALLFCVVGVNAKDNEWNIPEGLKKTNENNVCTSYEAGDYKFKIFTRDNDDDLAKYKKGFEKEENGMYKRFEIDATQSDNYNGVEAKQDILYGEYVKIGDKKYWVEAHHSGLSIGDEVDRDINKLKGFLTYFNEHNNATIIDV